MNQAIELLRERALEAGGDALLEEVAEELAHRGDPPGADGGTVMDIEVTGRGGGTVRMRVDRATGGLIE